MRVVDVLAEGIAGLDGGVVFGLPGDGNLRWLYELVHHHGVRFVGAPHEATAVMMADGYARRTGKVAVATVTQGPGLTNTITPLTEAARNRTPIVLVVGETSREDRTHSQCFDQRAVVLPTGAAYHQVRTASTVGEDLGIAVRDAVVGRRPVVLGVPCDLQGETAAMPPPPPGPPSRQAPEPDPAVVDEAVGAMATAKRPVVLAGRGAISDGARRVIAAVADRLGAPVATTLLAKGLFAGEALDLGICGTLSTAPAAEYLAEADCIVAFGCSLNTWTTAHGSYVDGARVIHCDTDPEAIGRWTRADVGIVGDAEATALAMLSLLEQLPDDGAERMREILRRALASYDAASSFLDTSGNGTVDARTLTLALDDALPSQRVVTCDAGRFMLAPFAYLPVRDAGELLFTSNFGSIGLGVGIAAGVAVAEQSRTSVALVGDGGFMMSGVEAFTAAVQHELDLLVVVYNDGSYGAEYNFLENEGRDTSLSMTAWPDLAPLARALGGAGVTVRSLADLARVKDAVRERQGPLLVDARLDAALASALQF